MKRVVDILVHKQHGIISDLVAAGMSPEDWTFSSDNYNHYYPGQYVTHLKNEISYLEAELEDYQFKLSQADLEIKDLKARTVAQLIAELHQEVVTANFRADDAEKSRKRAHDEVQLTRDKMKVWRALSTDV
jgi:hypothetical protein